MFFNTSSEKDVLTLLELSGETIKDTFTLQKPCYIVKVILRLQIDMIWNHLLNYQKMTKIVKV